MIFWGHAGRRHEAGDDAEPGHTGKAGAGRPSSEAGEGSGGRSTADAVAGVRRDVQLGGPAVDPTGAVAEGDVADGVVHGAERADALRATRIQPAFPLVS